MNAISFLGRNASKYPNKVGFIFEDMPYTYDRVLSASTRLALYLKAKGIVRGDKVCTLFYNSMEQAYATFSLLILGAVVVPVNFRFVAAEIAYIAGNSDAKAILYGEEFAEVIAQIRSQMPSVKFSMNLTKTEAERIAESNFSPKESQFLEGMKPEMNDSAFILYTSGTTGQPKGVVLTHSNVTWNQARIIWSSHFTRDDVMILPMPFFHSGTLGRFLSIVTAGGTIVSWKNFNAARVLEGITKYKATYLNIVPAMARMILALPGIKAHDVSSLRHLRMGAAMVPDSLVKQASEVFPNSQVHKGYGITENSSSVTTLWGEDVLKKPSSVGLPDYLTEVKIVDADYKDLPPNKVGEIAVRGPCVMKEYYKDAKATAETIRDGWLMTGDLGRVDEDGYLYIVGRKKDMIISGGENIYAAEVEAFLDSHPKVLESAVIGVPHPKWGETVLALLVLKPGQTLNENEIDEFCVSKMARYKRPRIIRIVDSLIKNAAGKTLKYELKKVYGRPEEA